MGFKSTTMQSSTKMELPPQTLSIMITLPLSLWVVVTIDWYFASVLEQVTLAYFLEIHDTKALPPPNID